VVGVAGGARKCEWLVRTLGLDAAVDYKAASFAADLKQQVGGGGADVVFDNVGGVVLDATLKHLARHARVVLCGAVSAMNEGPQPLHNLMGLIVKSASMRGFTLFDFQDQYEEAFDALAKHLLEGRLVYAEDVEAGLERAPRALLKLFGAEGGNFGKLLVDLHPSASPAMSSPSAKI
jgi:NADPH-dependent curcumin reductase CurA